MLRVLVPPILVMVVLGATAGVLLNVFEAAGAVAALVFVGLAALAGVLGAIAVERSPHLPR